MDGTNSFFKSRCGTSKINMKLIKATTMKKIYLILFYLMIGFNLKAADLYVNSSGATGTYTSLTAAVQAANDGDRIIISTLMNLVENVTINKSVTVTSASAGTTFTLNGTMTIEAVANKEIRIIGGDISALSFSSGTATDTTACKFYLVDSQVNTDINANIYGLSFNMLYCEDDDLSVDFKFGSIMGSSLSYFQLSSGSGTAQNDTTYILANKFTSECNINNQDHNYFVANNFFYVPNSRQLYINFSKPSNSGWNNILNNTFARYNSGYNAYSNNLYFANNYDYSNLNLFNNYFLHNNNSSSSQYYNTHIGPSSLTTSHQPVVQYNVFACPNWSSSAGIYWNSNLNSSNYNNYLESTSNYTYSTTDGKITVGANAINKGNPSIQYYDIDMTRNDMGTYGGPYTWENYHDTTSNGRGRVFNLDMPFEIWMGQTPTIKADAVHKK